MQEGVESRATQSVRVPVKNLARISPNLNVSLLQEAVGWQFLRTNVFGEDEGFEAASNQRGFQMIRPDNDWFPGLDHLRQEFYNHQWIFGKTPKFKVSFCQLLVLNITLCISRMHSRFEFQTGIKTNVQIRNLTYFHIQNYPVSRQNLGKRLQTNKI